MTDAIQRSLKLYPCCLQPILLLRASEGFTARHKITAKKENVSVQGIAAQFIYNAICGDLGG